MSRISFSHALADPPSSPALAGPLSRKQFLRDCLRVLASAAAAIVAAPLMACRPRSASDLTIGVSESHRAPDVPQIDPAFVPGYVRLHRTGELRRRGERLHAMMESCQLCPRQCGAARHAGERGFCGASAQLQVTSHHPHFGEERPLVGRGGSGTVFLTHCNLRCVFCINSDISHGGVGARHGIDDLAAMMLHLQDIGCHNINVVTPTHYSAHIVLALDRAAARGLRLPLVYNTSGWERLEVLALLDGVVDIYLPDLKYADSRMAATYSSDASTYPAMTRAAILEMHRQVGVARPAPDGLMYRGLMIRHLVMPNGVSGTRETMSWIAEHLPHDTYVNLMSQYRPAFKAFDYPAIARRLTRKEYDEAIAWAREAGLTRLDIQG
jgi:putative pyruvate formate lyase activating enzyme